MLLSTAGIGKKTVCNLEGLKVKQLITREQLAEIYLDWVSNYLTVEKFAEHAGLYVNEAEQLLEVCKQCHNIRHPES